MGQGESYVRTRARAASSGSSTDQAGHRRLLLLAVALLAVGAVLGAATATADTAPSAAIEAPSEVRFTTAHLQGTVNPNGGPSIAHWHFEYSKDPGGEGWTAGPDHELSQAESEESSPVAVAEDLADGTLQPATTYFVRLLASNEGGAGESSEEELTTEAVAKPTVSDIAVSAITAESAHFAAEVDPSGTDPAFAADWHFQCTPACKGLEGGTVPAGASQAEMEVENDATGLEPNTFYTVRLFASNAGGEVKSTETFQTAASGPLVHAFAAGPVGPEAAEINGEVDPRGSSTVYWFEWGSEDCSAPGSNCQSLPDSHDASAGDGPTYTYVSRHLSGLSPATTYHFRLVAENASGPTAGPDETFTTASPEPACTNPGALGTAFLPDCRAYEMVSPPDKNGQDVLQETFKTHVTPDGNGVTFAATGGFGSLQGTSFDAEYLARRTGAAGTNGWSTQGINPPGGAVTLAAPLTSNFPGYVDAFTPDLSAAVYISWRPLTDAPNTTGVSNLYRIGGLGGGAETTQLISAGAAPLPATWLEKAKLLIQPHFAGASTDLSHVVFESTLALTADAPPYQGFCALFGAVSFFGCPTHLYENADGVVRLVGRIPNGTDTACDDVNGPACVAAPSSQAGISATLQQYSQRMVSADGSRILFQTPVNAEAGNIYLREDGRRTYQLNVSEAEPSAAPQPATLWEASRDASRIFFTTSAPLLAADTDSNPDLYMYEVGKPAGERLTLISASSAVNEGRVTTVLGTSDDGHYVYFVRSGQLVAGQPAADVSGLYLWHDGTLSYIGHFVSREEAFRNGPRTTWGFGGVARTSRVTPDGRHLLFMTQSDEGFKGRGGFGGYDHSGRQELYLYSADSGRLACASCNPTGKAATVDALTNLSAGNAISGITSDLTHALSDDGRHVFFATGEELLPEDTNHVSDAYEYDSASGQIHLLSSGTDPAPSYLIDASNDGSDVFFATRQRLSAWDTDNAYDLYDARINGGLPEPAPVPAACAGDSCLPTAQSGPAPASAASQAVGPGNPKPPCPRGRHRVRRHGKLVCVKKRSAKHHRRHHRTANNSRRATK
jgi:hypothetical protein